MTKVNLIILAFLLLFLPERTIAQGANVREEIIPLKTYPFSDPNPIPEFGTIYPYFRFDGYSDKGAKRDWKMVVLENDYIKLWINPEVGGKIWGAIEKKSGKEFVYFNHVAKFRDVSMRGPWTSGGIEMNFGVIGHAPTCSTPVDYYSRVNTNGSVSCFVGAIDLPSRTRWSVEINLPKDKSYFTTRTVWDNSTSQDQSYYHWMNMAVKTEGNLEYVFPGKCHLGHDGISSSWPVDEQGRIINFYENNNFGGSKSYHIIGSATGFYGAYWHKEDFGFAHYSSYDEKPGKKIWIWGLSEKGMIWEKLLTDSDGQYTEIQSGRSFNQAAGKSSNTPFKNSSFSPGSTAQWIEYWFPVKQTQGLTSAASSGSVHLQKNGTKFDLRFCPNENSEGKLEVKFDHELVFSKNIHFVPLQVVSGNFEYAGNPNNISIWMNNNLIYENNHNQEFSTRPAETPSDFNWETAFGHYLKGKENENQRIYKIAEAEYDKALKIEPYFVPALIGKAKISYRKIDYNVSLEYSMKALSIDTYDPDANMIMALAALATGDTTSAIDGFSIAAQSASHKTVAYNELSSVCIAKCDYQRALEYAEKSLVNNQIGSEALQSRILCLRKSGLKEKAISALKGLEENDPLNHFIRFENYLTEPGVEQRILAQKAISNELPHETYLEYALWYFRKNQLSDAIKILNLAPQNHPIILIWEGYLNQLEGNKISAEEILKKALKINPLSVLPFRIETLKPLTWAQSLSSDWKINYYIGLININAGAEKAGRKSWEMCLDKPDFASFYMARSRLYESGSQQATADVERAIALGENEWRVALFASKYYLEQQNLLRAEELITSSFKKNPENYSLGLHYAKILELGKKYTTCVSVLQEIQVLPNEGATEGRTIWRNANIGNALNQISDKKYMKAIESVDLAKQWPANLGVGKPYQPDERVENFIALQCYKKLKDAKSMQVMQDFFSGKTNQIIIYGDEFDFLTAWTLKQIGNIQKADLIMKELTAKDSSSLTINWCNAIYSGNFELAETIESKNKNKDKLLQLLATIFNSLPQK